MADQLAAVCAGPVAGSARLRVLEPEPRYCTTMPPSIIKSWPVM
jgi:hypothetical protein